MFRERISRHYPTLSPSFKRIADFMLTSHQKAAFMSASRLAKHVGVDVATVTRFAQEIGYEGFIELIREVQEAVLAEMEKTRRPVQERLDHDEGPIKQTMWHDWASLEKTIENLRREEADRAIDALSSARCIYLTSEGVGHGLAIMAERYLKMVKPDVFVLNEGPFDMAMELKAVGPQDVVIAIGFTAYAFGATQALRFAREKGAITIGLIGQASCPLGQYADILFVAGATEHGYLPSPTSLVAIFFSLIYRLYLSHAEAYHRCLVDFQNTYAQITGDTARGDENVVDDLINFF
ncbi:MAG: MurR/RpiR family transcriptional regulator [Anaerolineae bacterium]|nr:MurR/RpiR family transcriptional regulator [Anaerolineae bacterium]